MKADWKEWVAEGKDIWAIVRVARNPFGLKEKGNAIIDQGMLLESDEDLKQAFVRHNLKTDENMKVRKEVNDRTEEIDIGVDHHILQRVRRALKKTKNQSAAGPDHISWRLLKMIHKTQLGRHLERDVARMADTKNRLRVPESWRQLTMVMIPRPYKSERLENHRVSKYNGEMDGEDNKRRAGKERAPAELCGKKREGGDRLGHVNGRTEKEE